MNLYYPALVNRAGRIGRTFVLLAALTWCAILNGCAALSNPVANAVPSYRLPPEILGRRRSEEKTIPLAVLRQKPNEIYLLDAGDVLGVYIETVLGDKTQPPPVRFSEVGNIPPSFGFPLPVREDGYVPVPLIEQGIYVKGLSLGEAQERIKKAYLDRDIIKEKGAKVIVTLIKPRTKHILVVRQDSVGLPGGATTVSLGQTKRGTGYVIDLPAYENDILNALTRTGGLPGLDAENEVRIERGVFRGVKATEEDAKCVAEGGANRFPGTQTIRIPLRLRPGEAVPFRPEDVILENGDVLFIEARDTELYYTGGLLPPRQFILPRDYDLDVVEAISLANGPLVNGATNVNNLQGNLITTGLGFPSPSLITILRKTPDYGTIPIRVNLNRALQDSRERILVQAGDMIILQETPGEAMTRYFSGLVRLSYFVNIVHSVTGTITSTATGP